MSERVVWTPVDFGWLHLDNHELNKDHDAIEVRKSAFETIPNNGVLLTISEEWGEREASVYLPDDIRLCRRVKELEAQLATVGTVPREVADTIKRSLVSSESINDTHTWMRRVDAATKWLSTLTEGDNDGK